MLNKYDFLDKKLYHLGHELQELNRRLYVTVPLPEPIRVGWRRFHVLSSKADGRKDKSVLKAILEVIETPRFSRIRDFREKRGRKHRRKLVEVDQPLRNLTLHEWEQKRLPDAWLSYFQMETHLFHRTWIDVLVFAQPSLYRLKVAPHFVSELQHLDPDVAQRTSEIHAWIQKRNLMSRLERACGWRHWIQVPNPKERYEKLAEHELRAVRFAPTEVDVTNDVRVRHISFRHMATFVIPPA